MTAVSVAKGKARRQPWASLAGAHPLDRVGSVLAMLALVLWANAVMFDTKEDEAARGGGSGRSPSSTDLLDDPATVIAGYVGAPYTHPSDLKFTQAGATDLTVHGVNWDGRPFKSPIYYGLRATRWHGDGSRFGSMLDFTHSKAIAQPGQTVRVSGTRNGRTLPETGRIGDMFKHLEFSHGHNMLTVNGLMRLGSLSSQVSPYIGGGFGANLPHTEIQFIGDAERTYEYQYTGPAGQVLAGVEVRLPRVTLFLEYKFTLSRQDAPLTGRDNKASFGYTDFFVQLAAWWRGEQPKHGTVRTWLASHQVIGGVGARIVRRPVTP
ncbi:MAG: outer membrane protein [Hyphomicrobiaceae bacterium]